MNVFERLHSGEAIDIRDEDYQREAHIKKNAWIGARVNILPGVTIGENAIVGTGSIVTKDIPDNAVAVGNPARVVKMIDKK
ncbi:DapH/DapD/GlmU-related protein [Butyrivibrio sp. AC2005]|uniref:DapH/DapD/GlmU-related protein n=1 Tax=Butyrivibrio sp. AC2005 TaxID=1280672 RepID=UPI0004245C43|nr:DapH/DapD/GlmU-related protein [Butyrivibrio sp. AC2005]